MLKSILDAILVPTWLHFGSIFQVLGHLGGILGRLGGVLGRLGALLGASWRILARLGASWGVLEPSWRRFGPQEKSASLEPRKIASPFPLQTSPL